MQHTADRVLAVMESGDAQRVGEGVDVVERLLLVFDFNELGVATVRVEINELARAKRRCRLRIG